MTAINSGKKNRVYTEGKRRQESIARFIQCLLFKSASTKNLAAYSGLSEHTVLRYIAMFKKAKIVYVSGWAKSARGTKEVKLWSLGNKDNVPRPLSTSAERSARHKAKKKAIASAAKMSNIFKNKGEQKLKCQECGQKAFIKENRPRLDGSHYRRYSCECGNKFSTQEYIYQPKKLPNGFGRKRGKKRQSSFDGVSSIFNFAGDSE